MIRATKRIPIWLQMTLMAVVPILVGQIFQSAAHNPKLLESILFLTGSIFGTQFMYWVLKICD